MAAYAALVSVMHILDQLQLHPRPPISLDEEQAQSLIQKVSFLQAFLEDYSHCNYKEVDVLESRIAETAHAAEDVIESHIVDQILAGSTSDRGDQLSSDDFYQGLHKVIEGMDSIKKEAMEIKEKIGFQQDHLQRSSSAGSLRFDSVSTGNNRSIMVGLDDVLYETMDKLTRGQPHRQIIPITGMGGIGKTTLARNIYKNQVVIQYFDILAWVTISQEYSIRQILLEALQEDGESLSLMSVHKLGEKLYKKLSGWRYLIVIDDIWDIEVWDGLKFFFPENNNGSRIMMTTRLSNLAVELTNSNVLEMKFLDDDTSWNLLCKNVFGKKDCPTELEEIGKRIAKNCKGLPLSIVVVGGILAKSELTRQYWENIAENLSSIVNLEDNEHCLQILYTSYNILPVHLKPCSLHMRIFPEDSEIRASKLFKLWIAEGFLKPICGKNWEEVAEEYLRELMDRNLILVHEHSSIGKIKYCKMHDLLRDLCLREAQKQKFPERSPSVSYRLLRVATTVYEGQPFKRSYTLEYYFQQVNLRYLYVEHARAPFFRSPSSVSLLWNLQTLIVHNLAKVIMAPFEIWKMPLLRHVHIRFLELPDPPCGNIDVDGRDDTVLKNLQTLLCIYNFKSSPNIKKLTVYFDKEGSLAKDCVNNLGQLHKLENLGCLFDPVDNSSHLVKKLIFPHSLKKLTLLGSQLHWEELTTIIGSLPLLEVLKLKMYSCLGAHWETVEGQFSSLKFLLIEKLYDLEYSTSDNTHFPCLEHLILRGLSRLMEIPSSIGDIPTLQSIKLENCSDSAVESAKTIQEEQEEFGNVGLKVQVV